jgi:prepilin-type N-terminal cleavage/methylation domain-containing protein
MKMKSGGFTIIELVIVISILGILAAVAVPKLFNITPDAQSAATKAVAGALGAVNGENNAARTINSIRGGAVANCTDVGTLLQGGLPSGYSIVSAAVSASTTITCTVNGPSSTSATFFATGMP